ncbi:golgin subfamily A member 6-like protein 22 isoform X1 [Varroa destructor]|uniref:Uncharacterized protein n=1 Tax=Varroa destructor TaxID=109461 RepID=A0A7M7M6T4_VARDE|nr:golgin subfamily A member 6-like protein 22 isoform X1 [Varroa destructor]XP_022653819.1 golgin subfamily A member 6-like protein 22 isoform X1 [Varroa destructor]
MKARKATFEPKVYAPFTKQLTTSEATKPATSPSHKHISTDSEDSDELSEGGNCPSATPIPSAEKDKQKESKQPVASPPQERPLVPAASIRERSTIPKSSLLDVDSLAEIDIKKVSVADLQMAASTDDVDDRSRTYSSKEQDTYANGNLNLAITRSTEARHTRTDVDDLIKQYELEIEKLKDELEKKESMLEQKDNERSEAQESKISEWQSKIEEKLQNIRQAQDLFFESVRNEFSQIQKKKCQDREERRLQEEKRLAKEEQDRIKEAQRREDFEAELKTRYEAMVDRINRVNGLVVQKMRTEHEQELMLVERTKQQEIDQVMKAFDQGRAIRDITTRIQSIVAVMEGLQHSLMSDFCEKLERRLQLMEKRLAGATTIDDLIQHFRTIAENVSEANDGTRAELARLRKELRSFTDEQEDFRHLLLREHRSFATQVIADKTSTQTVQQAFAAKQEQVKSFLASWEGELERREKQVQNNHDERIRRSRSSNSTTAAAISQAIFLWRSCQHQPH